MRIVLFVHDKLTRYGFLAGGLGLMGIVALYCFEVFSRYVTNSPSTWSVDVISYLLCISMSLAIPELARRHEHISISILPDSLSPEARSVWLRVVYVLAAVVCLAAGGIAVTESMRQFAQGTLTAASMNVPKFAISSFIAYGLVNSGLHYMRHVFTQPVN